MRHRTTVAGIAILFSAIPFFVSAVTVEELTAQVQNLMVQLAALQRQVTNSNQGSVNPVLPAVLTTPNYCPPLTRTLSRGSEGLDVLALQKYLIFQEFLTADSNSGFFGPATESAVRNWQQTYGVVSSGDALSTGWGVVGVRTRAAIAAECVNLNGQTPQASLSCSLALPPPTMCSMGWQANRDSNSCVTSWYCVSVVTRYFTSASSTATSSSASTTTSSTAATSSTDTNTSNLFTHWCLNGIGDYGYWSETPCPASNNSGTYGSSANVQEGTSCAPEGRQEFVACPFMANCPSGGTYFRCEGGVWKRF